MQKITSPHIAVIVPAFNEQNIIPKIIEKIKINLPKGSEIIVIDDGSEDNTSQIVSSLNVILLTHKKNMGYGAAIRTGLNYCKNERFDIVITIDADGQHDPYYINSLINPILNHKADFVIANRFFHGYKLPLLKRLFIRSLSVIYLILFKQWIRDPTNGYRAMSNRLYANLKLESNYSVSQEMLIKILPHFEAKEIPIRMFPRRFGNSFVSAKKYFVYIFFMIIKEYIIPKLRNRF